MSTPTPEPAPDTDALRKYVHATAADDWFITLCTTEAAELIKARVGSAAVPDSVLSRARLEVGADLFWRRAARHGVAVFDGTEPTPLRISRDPIKAAEPILAPYLGWGIA